jgi:SAM-dependent methyltransferase
MALPDRERLYGDLAWIWPIMSPPEEYVEEAETFAAVIREHARIPVRTLLHLTCGGGHADRRLKEEFKITGVDASGEMLGLARRLNPEVDYVAGDARTVRLGCLFDSVFIDDGIVYMRTEADLRKIFQTAFEHLKPGGVMLTYAEATPETFEQNKTECTRRSSGGTEVVYVENFYDPDTSDTTYETTFVYIIRTGGELTVETDLHVCGIFPLETWRNGLRETGFDIVELEFGHSTFPQGFTHPMFVCAKPE